MAIRQYLAMTATEMAHVSSLPHYAAWMACHFSPYSTGLTNLPTKLPPECLLILNDRTPIHGHEPERILRELEQLLHRFQCPGLLLDFQNPPCPETMELTEYLTAHLDVTMAVPPEYASDSGRVFLPPVPTDVSVEDYLMKWQGREIWLEAALEGQNITLTPNGALYGPNRCRDFDFIHEASNLHCHYSMEEAADSIIFHTWRTPEDLEQLLLEAQRLGVTQSIGLYQELAEATDYNISSNTQK